MVIRCTWSVTLSAGLEDQLNVGGAGVCLSLKLIAVISSAATTVDHAVSVCFLVPMLMGLPFRKERKPEDGVHTKAVEVASGSLSPCIDFVQILFRGLPVGALPLL